MILFVPALLDLVICSGFCCLLMSVRTCLQCLLMAHHGPLPHSDLIRMHIVDFIQSRK